MHLVVICAVFGILAVTTTRASGSVNAKDVAATLVGVRSAIDGLPILFTAAGALLVALGVRMSGPPLRARVRLRGELRRSLDLYKEVGVTGDVLDEAAADERASFEADAAAADERRAKLSNALESWGAVLLLFGATIAAITWVWLD